MGNEINQTQLLKPSACSVAKEYVQTATGMQNLVIRPVVHALKFTELALAHLACSVKGPRELFRLADHLFYWVGYPGRIKGLGRSVHKFKEGLSSGSVRKIGSKVSKLYSSTFLVVGLVASGVKHLHNRGIISLAAPYLSILEKIDFLGSIGMLLFALHQIKKQVKIMWNTAAWSPEFNLAFIRTVGRVCLAAIAAFNIIAYFQLAVVSQWIYLGLSVGMLSTTLGGHFYDKIHVPKQPKPV